MPELPEVETIRQSLLPYILQKSITDIDVNYPRILQDVEPVEFRKELQGTSFLDIRRRGKYLLFLLSSGKWMVAHLRMTGRLMFLSSPEIPLEKHTSVVFHFDDQSRLVFWDQRKFATLNFLEEKDLGRIRGLHLLGPEPLSEHFHLEDFAQAVNRPAKIKGILLDQRRIAGLGNIYADETLFRAKVHPTRAGNSLHPKEVKRLFGAIRDVLTEAIANQGTTIRDYRTGYGTEGSFQNRLLVYGKKGNCCPICDTPIQRIRVAGRGSHFCPKCQKEDVT